MPPGLMKVGVISDTHDNLDAIKKAVKLFNDEGVALVLHAGDFVAPFTAKPFSALNARLVGIFGNNDGDKLLLKERFEGGGVGELHEDPHELKLGGRSVIITHRPQIVNALAKTYDVVIYGHTHQPEIRREGGRLILNPGECGGWLSGRRTVALLDVEKLEAELREL